MIKSNSVLPSFTKSFGVLPAGDYLLTLDEIRRSYLVTGEGCSQDWDKEWRSKLVDNLAVIAGQLWKIGIEQIFIDGSFVENKSHPNDIDGYFECDAPYWASGQLQKDLNDIDPHQCWSWDNRDRRPHIDSAGKQHGELPVWRHYRIDLYPHNYQSFASIDFDSGKVITYADFFRRMKTRKPKPPRNPIPKGIIRLVSAKDKLLFDEGSKQ